MQSSVHRENHFINITKPPIELKINEKKFFDGPPILSSLKFNKNSNYFEFISEGRDIKLTTSDDNDWMIKKFLFASKKEMSNESEIFFF